MDFEDVIIFLVLLLCAIGIITLSASYIYVEYYMCDDTTTEEITIWHKYTENAFGGVSAYYYISMNEISHQMWGDACGARFYLLECNQTYNVAYCGNGNARFSCSEEKI